MDLLEKLQRRATIMIYELKGYSNRYTNSAHVKPTCCRWRWEDCERTSYRYLYTKSMMSPQVTWSKWIQQTPGEVQGFGFQVAEGAFPSGCKKNFLQPEGSSGMELFQQTLWAADRSANSKTRSSHCSRGFGATAQVFADFLLRCWLPATETIDSDAGSGKILVSQALGQTIK